MWCHNTTGTKNERVVFFHPDLGIGGAERLIIDAAVGLQNLGHKVTIFTSHCDPSHCFDEARDGTLDVRVRGNTIIPPQFLGRFSILCAILRQIHLILQIAVFSNELVKLEPTAFVIDQLSAGVPLLRLVCTNVRILFYCHFPDKLLALKGGLLKNIYRIPFDFLESWSTDCSDVIVVNSKFTKGVFGDSFPRIIKKREPKVIYPCVDLEEKKEEPEPQKLWPNKKILLSINRFERKKDVGLAIKAFAQIPEEERRGARLVIAGGYDQRVVENVSYHKELEALANSFKLQHATARNLATALAVPEEVPVLFLLSVPSAMKASLLHSATMLIYTPLNEHFGIVPLEAMLHHTPVLAANRGGPTETVIDGRSGWLRDVNKVEDWAAVMYDVLSGKISSEQLAQMGQKGRSVVFEKFGKDTMAQNLSREIEAMKQKKYRPEVVSTAWMLTVLLLGPTLLLGIGISRFLRS